MQLSVNLKTLIDFFKKQKRQTLGFSSPAHLLLYSPCFQLTGIARVRFIVG